MRHTRRSSCHEEVIVRIYETLTHFTPPHTPQCIRPREPEEEDDRDPPLHKRLLLILFSRQKNDARSNQQPPPSLTPPPPLYTHYIETPTNFFVADLSRPQPYTRQAMPSTPMTALLCGGALLGLLVSCYSFLKTLDANRELRDTRKKLKKEQELRKMERTGRTKAERRLRLELKALIKGQTDGGVNLKPVARMQSPFKGRCGTPRQGLLAPNAKYVSFWREKLYVCVYVCVCDIFREAGGTEVIIIVSNWPLLLLVAVCPNLPLSCSLPNPRTPPLVLLDHYIFSWKIESASPNIHPSLSHAPPPSRHTPHTTFSGVGSSSSRESAGRPWTS